MIIIKKKNRDQKKKNKKKKKRQKKKKGKRKIKRKRVHIFLPRVATPLNLPGVQARRRFFFVKYWLKILGQFMEIFREVDEHV